MTGPPISRPSAHSQPQSPATGTPQRRIILKINPLKTRASISSSSSTPPTATTRDVHVSDEGKKPRPKIKIKPLRASIAEAPQAQDDLMDVDTPVREPSPSTVVASPVDVITPVQVTAPEPLLPLQQFVKPKIPRPVKLKPLKEVLQRLITQIKRKDDYAFFLQPVDPGQVPGYSDAVKNPMDLGTMTEKVEKGRYRALEQFKDDFLLVTSNAKVFNPPSTLYHTEANKIEAWGLEQIARASAHVIEYEADWTIDVVADGEPTPSGDQDEPSATPGDETGRAGPSRARSPSVLSSAAGVVNLPLDRSKRSKSKRVLAVTESFEEGWHLPGYKDGVGVFPPGSELAALMLELKLRGKKWTKKERLKREKEGPPYAPEGSLDYYELQHPFPSFRGLVPEEPTVPQLIPLITTSTTLTAPETARGTPEASQPPEDRVEDQASKGPPGPVAIPLGILPDILDEPGKYVFSDPPLSTSQIGAKKLQHWTITRNPPRGTRAREDEDDGAPGASSQKRRRAEPTDYGSLATLVGTVAAENGLKASDFEKFFGQDEQLLDQIRKSIENSSSPAQTMKQEDEDFADSDDFIRDVVYGGVDGLAYFRSLAEFVGELPGSIGQDAMEGIRQWDAEVNHSRTGKLGMPLAQWVVTHVVGPLTRGNHAVFHTAASILAASCDNPQEADRALADYIAGLLPSDLDEGGNETNTRRGRLDAATLESMRAQLRELADLEDPEAPIEIAGLLRAPEELFLAESAWAGGLPTPAPTASSVATSDPTVAPASSVASTLATVPASASAANSTPGAIPDPAPSIGDAADASPGPIDGGTVEQGQAHNAPTSACTSVPAVATVSTVPIPPTSATTSAISPGVAVPVNAIDRALLAGAEALRVLSMRCALSSLASENESKPTPAAVDPNITTGDATMATAATSTGSATVIEDALTRRTRLGLIALAKRAPIDRIARLPPELVPVHIRHIVPTLTS